MDFVRLDPADNAVTATRALEAGHMVEGVATTGLIPSGHARFGVDAKGIDAFAAAFKLSDHERNLVLPFMLSCEALLRVEHAGIKRGRVKRAIAMTEALLDDLKQL